MRTLTFIWLCCFFLNPSTSAFGMGQPAYSVCEKYLTSTLVRDEEAPLEAAVRTGKVDLLAQLDRNAIIPVLEQLLSRPEREIRSNSILALTSLHATEALPLIESLARDRDPEVRASALASLISLQSPRLQVIAREAIHDPMPGVGERALTALAAVGNEQDILTIESIAADRRTPKRMADAAIKALGIARADRSIALLEAIVQGSVRSAASVEQARAVLAHYYGIARHHTLYSQDPTMPQEFFDSTRAVEIRKFRKSGSQTFLLGGPLAGKVIQKVISKEAYKAWKKAFEANDAWKEAGFDYVPIEPILTREEVVEQFRLDPLSRQRLMEHENTLRKTNPGDEVVYSRVLGSSMSAYLSRIDSGAKRLLENARGNIMHVTSIVLALSHGHPHDMNFCIETSSGKLRLYLIDLDEAREIH